MSPTIRKLSVYEKYYLSYFSNQQHNSPEPLLIHDPEHAITFRIRSKFAQEKANSYVKYTHNYLKGGMWRLASRTIKPYFSISNDEENSLIKACFFDGYSYLVYGDEETLEIRPFEPLTRAAPRHVRYTEKTCPGFFGKDVFLARRDSESIISIYNYSFRDDGPNTPISLSKRIRNVEYPPDPILSAARVGLPLHNGIKLFQSAYNELLRLPVETDAQAKKRIDETQERIGREFPIQCTSTTLINFFKRSMSYILFNTPSYNFNTFLSCLLRYSNDFLGPR